MENRQYRHRKHDRLLAGLSCRVALVLQGGGALGAYQAGVYQAMHEDGIEPDWVSGVSIGAVNAAIIAGNKPEDRLERLTTFWTRITDRTGSAAHAGRRHLRQMRNATPAYTTLLGQPGFFKPGKGQPLAYPAGGYATGQLRQRPLRDSGGAGRFHPEQQSCRFSVGAVNVLSGNFIFFDNAKHGDRAGTSWCRRATPAFSPVIARHFWDGGIVSTLPCSIFSGRRMTTSPAGLPDRPVQRRRRLAAHKDVMSREKDIAYSSRTRQVTDMFQRLQRWKICAYLLLKSRSGSDQTRSARCATSRYHRAHRSAADLSAEDREGKREGVHAPPCVREH